MRRAGLALVALVVLVWAACPKKEPATKPDAQPGGKVTATLFFTADLRGEIEPCGCNSDPLGDLARLASLIATAKQDHPTALFDGGSNLYGSPQLVADGKTQAELKAKLVATQLPRLGLVAAGLGAYDLAGGKEGLAPPRQAANAPAGFPTEAPKVIELGGMKIGVFGLVDPETVPGASDMTEAAKKQIAALRGQGAQVVIVLAEVDRKEARGLARAAPGADIIVANQDADDPKPGLSQQGFEQVSGTIIVQPLQRGQSTVRLDVTIDPKAPAGGLVDAIGEARAKELAVDMDRNIADLDAKIAEWKKQSDADPAFIKTKQDERDELALRKKELLETPSHIPAAGSYFMGQHIRIKRQLPCDAEVQKAKRDFEEAAGKANLAGAKPPRPPGPGESGYAGIEECESCHQKQVAFWKHTHHAQAWATLVNLGKQWNRDCINCHVTGWDKPGGSTFAENEKLRDVQCEVCHGPAGKHVDSFGKDRTGLRSPGPSVCLGCHTVEHSDTFNYEAYLKDVTGPGHAEGLHDHLPPGPTGHELRQKALEAAGRNIGAGCTK